MVGIEYAYETQLHGKVGMQKVETNARGQILGIVESGLMRVFYNNDQILEFINENVLGHISTLLFILSITWIVIIILKAFKSVR